jgi:hypothetical protein
VIADAGRIRDPGEVEYPVHGPVRQFRGELVVG